MKRDNRREISRKRIQQNRRIILKRTPNGGRHILPPATVLNPTADADLLASSIRMLTDEFQDLSMSQITTAYGVYDEEIDLQGENSKDHRRQLSWLTEPTPYLRKDHPYITEPLLVSTAIMYVSSVLPPPQVFQRDPQDSWESPHKTEKSPIPTLTSTGKAAYGA
jgi:hypothetical protein